MSDVFTNQEVLVAHANARLNLHGRRLLVSRVIEEAKRVAHVAKELGISRQCALSLPIERRACYEVR